MIVFIIEKNRFYIISSRMNSFDAQSLRKLDLGQVENAVMYFFLNAHRKIRNKS